MSAFFLAGVVLLAPQDPVPPERLEQRDESFSPAAPAGFVDDDDRVALRASLQEGPGSFDLRLEVEVKTDTAPFDGTGLLEGRPAGGSAEVIASGLAAGFYHWRARAVDSFGFRSAWVEFDASPNADFGVAQGQGPVPPVDGGPAPPQRLAQSDRSGGIAVDAGLRDPDGVVALRASVSHTAGSGNLVQIEVEVKAEPAAFDGAALAVGNPVAGTGGVSEAVVAGLAEGAYRWRARALDHAGRRSPWVEFDADPAPDFFVGGAAPMPLPMPTPPDSDDDGNGCGAMGLEVLLLRLLPPRRKSKSLKSDGGAVGFQTL